MWKHMGRRARMALKYYSVLQTKSEKIQQLVEPVAAVISSYSLLRTSTTVLSDIIKITPVSTYDSPSGMIRLKNLATGPGVGVASLGVGFGDGCAPESTLGVPV